MPPTPSITCKTVQLHANSPVSRPEVDPKVTTGISSVLIGPLWQRGRDGERARGDGARRREGAGERDGGPIQRAERVSALVSRSHTLK